MKQLLINNNYTNRKVETLINKFVNKKQQNMQNEEGKLKTSIPIFYNNQMHANYRTEERVLRDIIDNNTKCTDSHQKLNVIFYYKNTKTSNLVMKNNMAAKSSQLRQTNIIYNFECTMPHCRAERYIGMTQTTLSRRLTYHAQSGSIFNHFKFKHNCKPSREQLVENTTIIAKADNRYKLAIKEALLILKHAPAINKQFDNFVNILKLHSYRKLNANSDNQHPTAYIEDDIASDVPCLPNLDPPSNSSTSIAEPQILQITLPHTISANNCEPVDINKCATVPDMDIVLLRFGITYSNLTEVPLQHYRWWNFGMVDTDDDNASIAQRIGAMVRGARRPYNIPAHSQTDF